MCSVTMVCKKLFGLLVVTTMGIVLYVLLRVFVSRNVLSFHLPSKRLNDINDLNGKSFRGKEKEITVDLSSENANHTISPKYVSGHVLGSVVGRSHGGYFVSFKELPPPEKDLSDKYIIYKCHTWCGGLADRQRGIVTAYVLSQMLRRKFGIIMNNGCDFSNYVVPNIVNWTVTDDLLKGKSSGHKGNVDNNKFGLEMRDGDLEDIFTKDVMYYRSNRNFVHYLMHKQSYRLLSWTNNQTLYGVYRISFAHLFRLAPETERKYDTFMRELSSSPLICAHLRMGRSKTLPLDLSLPFKPDLKSVIKFLQGKLLESSKLFVATDSDDTREKMRTSFPSHFIEVQGKIVHIDRYRNKLDCTGMEKAILDQFILTKCDVFVASNSGFSWIAAILRGTNDGLFRAVRDNVTAENLNSEKIELLSFLINWKDEVPSDTLPMCKELTWVHDEPTGDVTNDTIAHRSTEGT